MQRNIDEINKFGAWATSLGFTAEEIPCDSVLKSIFKSTQNDMLTKLMRRVKPKDEVIKIRRAIIAKRLQDVESKVLSAADHAALPKSMQEYMKLQELRKKRDETLARIEDFRKKHESTNLLCQTLNIKIVVAKEKCEELQTKLNFLEFKSESLDKEIELEKNLNKNLIANMPTMITPANDSKVMANEMLVKAFHQLEKYYECVDKSNGNELMKKRATEEFWHQMRESVGKIPNSLMFSALRQSLEKQVKDIMLLNNVDENLLQQGLVKDLDQSQHSISTSKSALTPFKLKLVMAEVDAIILSRQYFDALKMHSELEAVASAECENFLVGLKSKLKASDQSLSEAKIDDFLAEFSDLFNKCHYVEGEISFLKEYIQKYKDLNAENRKEVALQKIFAKEVSHIYEETQSVVNEAHTTIELVTQIKDKILYTFNVAGGLLKELHHKHARQSNDAFKTFTNASFFGSGESFSITAMGAGDSILSSTKVELATSPTTHQVLANESYDQHKMAQHCLELRCFHELPLRKLSFSNSICDFYAGRNPILTEARELSKVLELTPAVELTAHGMTFVIRKSVLWAELIKLLTSDVKLELAMPIVDGKHYAARKGSLEAMMEELLRKINFNSGKAKHTLASAMNIHKLIVENPLASFIPATRRFKNTSYKEFEAEFKAYYNIISSAGQIRK